MTNRDEIKQIVDNMVAGWFNGEGHDVDKDDIIELVMKYIAASADPVATVAVMGVSGVRVLIPHPPGSVDRLPIGAKLYAAPPAQSVAVKALEWKKVALDSGHWNWLEVEKAETAFGEYSLQKHTKGYLRIISKTSKIGFFEPDKRSEAKAAAQADYEARIRTALSAQVQDVDHSTEFRGKTI